MGTLGESRITIQVVCVKDRMNVSRAMPGQSRDFHF